MAQRLLRKTQASQLTPSRPGRRTAVDAAGSPEELDSAGVEEEGEEEEDVEEGIRGCGKSERGGPGEAWIVTAVAIGTTGREDDELGLLIARLKKIRWD